MRTSILVTLAALFTVSTTLVACKSSGNNNPVCGDGVLDTGETCDGTNLAGEDCISQGFTGGTLSCGADCTFDTSACTSGPVCGDNTQEGTEVCDGSDLVGEDCISQGFDGGALACAGDCSAYDSSACFACGDGNIDAGESCDGSNVGLEDCTTQGFLGGTLACAGDCTFDTTGCFNQLCGNDTREGTEICDGVDLDGQDCSTVGGGFDAGLLGCLGDCSGFDTSLCFVQGSGETCADPYVVLAPENLSYDTSLFVDDYGVNVGIDYTACGGNGGFGPDVVFSVDVADGDILDVTVDNQDFTAALVISTDCADIEGSCVSYEEGGAGNRLDGTFENTSGAPQTVFVVLDSGFSGSVQEGNANISFTLRTPACGDGFVDTGEVCDDGNVAPGDGCDAACAVEGGFSCIGEPSVCFTAGAGDVCGTPISIVASGSVTIDSAPFTDDYGVDVGTDYTACGGNGGFGQDVVFSVDVADGDVLEVTVSNQDFNAALVFSTDCADIEGSCFFYDEGGFAPLTNSYTNTSGAPETIFVVFDSGNGFGTADGTADIDFVLRTPVCGDGIVDEQCDDGNAVGGDGCDATCQVEAGFVCSGVPSVCTVPPPDDTCVDPRLIDPAALPYADAGDTTGFANDYAAANGACAGIGGTEGENSPDIAYSFTPTVSGAYRIVYTPTFDGAVYITTDCLDMAGGCLAGSEAGGANFDETLNVSLTAATTYFIIVDGGLTGGAEGTYALTVEQAVCGDGINDANEECDDGNTTPGDGCDANCQVELISPEFIIGCDPAFCVMTAGAGPNGGDLYTFTIPAIDHPVVDHTEAGCFGGTAAVDLIINLDSTGYTNFSATTCTATAADSSLAVFDANPVGAATEIACDDDAAGEAAFCSEITDSGAAGPGLPTPTPGTNDMWILIDEWTPGDYWDGLTDRVIEIELIP